VQLSALVQDFVQRSIKRQNHFWQGVVGSVISVIIALTGLAIFAINKSIKANDLADRRLIDGAKTAANSGDWQTAFESYGKAITYNGKTVIQKVFTPYDELITDNHPERIALEVERLKSFFPLGKLTELQQELKPFENRNDLGEHAATILLIRGDFLMSEMNYSGGENQGRELIRLALAQPETLSNAVLAENFNEAVAYFQEARQHDPFHHRVNTALLTMLFYAGKFDEVRQHVKFMQYIYPEDTTPYFVDVLIEFFENNRNEIVLQQKLVQLKKKVGEKRVEELVVYFGIMEDVSNLINKVFLSSQNVSLADVIYFTPIIIMLMAKNTSIKQTLGLNTPTVHWLYDGGDVLISTLFKLVFPYTRNAALGELMKATEKKPDSMLLLILGIIQMAQADMKSANQSLWKAAEVSSMVLGSRRQAHLWAIWTDAFLLQKPTDFDNSSRIVRLQKNIHWLIGDGNLNDLERQQIISMVVKSIMISKLLLDSGHLLLVDWQTKEPQNFTPVKLLAKLELRAGNYAAALKVTNRVLTHKPDEQDMLKVKKASIEGLKKTLESISPVR